MKRHTENPGMVRAVYSRIFRDIQQYSAMVKHTEGHFKGYSAIFRHIHNSVTLAYTTVPYSEPWHIYNPKHLQKSVKHVRCSGIFRALAESEQFPQVFSRTSRDTQRLMHI